MKWDRFSASESRPGGRLGAWGPAPRLTRTGIIGAWLVLAVPLSAQSSQEAGKRLIQECLAAVGGEAFLNMRDRVVTGRAYQFYQERLRGLAYVTYSIRYDPKPATPDPGWLGVRERREYGKNRDYGALFFEGKGYEITFRGAQPYPESYMLAYRQRLRRDIFYILKYRLDEPGMIFESLGTEIVDLQPTDAVRITDADNESVTVYLLKSSHLPLRQDYVRRDPKTREAFRERAHYSKYRTFSGVQLPMNLLQERDGEKIFELFADGMQINPGLSDAVFAIGRGVKVLPAEK
jgi:hypothetical protein